MKYNIIITGEVDDTFDNIEHTYDSIKMRINSMLRFRDGVDITLDKIQLELK